MSNASTLNDNNRVIIDLWEDYEKIESIEDKLEMHALIKDKIDSLQLYENDYNKHIARLNNEEFTYIKMAFSEHINKVDYQVAELDKVIKNQFNEISSLKKNYYANIISIMGIFLAIFALILGNIQIIQHVQSESISKMILYVYISTSFIVIAVTVLMMLVENIIKSSDEKVDFSLYSKIIWLTILLVPFIVYGYVHRNTITGIHGGLVAFILFIIFITIVTITSNSNKR